MGEQRVTWTTRISVRPSTKKAINEIAGMERVSVATVIGAALDQYLTARST